MRVLKADARYHTDAGGASKTVGFHAELMEWMPPPDGIAMCQSDVYNNVTQRREHP
jgi:hypothetical protein